MFFYIGQPIDFLKNKKFKAVTQLNRDSDFQLFQFSSSKNKDKLLFS